MLKTRKRRILFISIAGFLIVCAVASITIFQWYNSNLKILYPLKYAELVEKYAMENEIDEVLLYAVIRTESSFDSNAVSVANAKGLTQITPDTFEWLQTKTGEKYENEDLFDEEIAIKYGALFLGMLKKEFGETETLLAAYHAGRGKVNSWLKEPEISKDGVNLDIIPIPATRYYVYKVTDAIEKYNKLYEFDIISNTMEE